MSLRDPGAFVDESYPNARLGSNRFFKGSGSSQAAAIVSGAVATLLQQRPWMTPDQVKSLLMNTASSLPRADPVAQGEGLINLHDALGAPRCHPRRRLRRGLARPGWGRSSKLGDRSLRPTATSRSRVSKRSSATRGTPPRGRPRAGKARAGREARGGAGRGQEIAGAAAAGLAGPGRVAPGAGTHGRAGRGADGPGPVGPGAAPAGRQASGGPRIRRQN